MERIRELHPGGKLLLLALVAMVILFAVLYPMTLSREGYLYNDQILVPGTENGNTTYSAEVKGEQWCFTVTPDHTVSFRCGDKLYGPYTVKEDPTAIPAGDQLAAQMTGVDIRCGDDILFRGGIYDTGHYWIMTNEDGTRAGVTISVTRADGTKVDGDGNPYDPMKPRVSTVLDLVHHPEITHKGHGGFWFVGTICALIAAAYILFADELFQLKFVFRARNPEDIEPSDWELSMRPISWTIMVVMTLVVYMRGLNIVV